MISLRNTTNNSVRVLTNLGSIQWSQGKNGCLKLTAKASIDRGERNAFYNNDAVYDLKYSPRGRLVWRGRTEIVKLVGNDLELTAMGKFRYFSDPYYHAVWSTTKYNECVPVEIGQFGPKRNAKMYNIDNNNRMYIGLTKGTVYRHIDDIGMQVLRFPLGTVRPIVGVQCLLEVNLPVGVNWIVQMPFLITAPDGSYTFTGFSAITISSSGAYTIPVFFSGSSGNANAVSLDIYNNSGANYTNTAENGTYYVKVTELRVVTSSDHSINTTLSTGLTAGSNVLATVGSGATANMYVGQRVWVGANATTGEIVTVLSIPAHNQFRADFAQNHGAFNDVDAHVIHADQIAEDLLAKVNIFNPGYIDSNPLVTSPKVDLFERAYYGQRFDKVLNSLTTLPDNSSPPVFYKAEVRADSVFRFTQRAADSRTWYLYLKETEIQKVLDSLSTEVLVEWETTSGLSNVGYSYNSPDVVASARYGLKRTGLIKASTTSEIEAKLEGNAELNDKKVLAAQAAINIDKITAPNGATALLEDIQPFDTCVLINLPGSISPSIEKIRRFTISETEITLDEKGQRVRIIPDLPMPGLEFLLIKRSLIR